MDSEDDCDGFYLQKHLLSKGDNLKPFALAEHSLINQFGLNILESADISQAALGVGQHLPPFACNADDVMMSIEDFKPSIITHNQ